MMRRILSQAGFTMIELLVVIAVLGILAVAVLSAINPIEQINKGRDTGHQSDAEQLLSGVDRYFALHELYPWNDMEYNAGLDADETIDEPLPNGDNCAVTTINGFDFCLVPDGVPLDTSAATLPAALTTCTGNLESSWMCALTETSEVKPSFTDRLRAASVGNELYLYKEGTKTASLHVCFVPQSDGFKKNAVDACSTVADSGATVNPGQCPGTQAGTTYTKSGDPDLPEMICL